MKRHIIVGLTLLTALVALPSFAQSNDVSVWLIRPHVRGTASSEDGTDVRLRVPVTTGGR